MHSDKNRVQMNKVKVMYCLGNCLSGSNYVVHVLIQPIFIAS